MKYGKGLNSIRWRFALAATGLTLIGGAWRDQILASHPAWQESSLLLFAALLGGAVFLMASRVRGHINALQRSADALSRGDFAAPVELDGDNELGSLAQSFSELSSRLDANALRINTLAHTDPITALPNRSVIDHLLRYALAPERAAAFSGALMFIDLDGFKRVNDMLGHDGGDSLLREAAQRILHEGLGRTAQTLDSGLDAFGVPCERLPRDTVFARFAGDEFVALLPGLTDREVLTERANRILDCLRRPFRVKGQEVVVGASLGIALAPDDTRSAAELLSFADMAMNGAKQEGKSRIRFFDTWARRQMVRHAETESELRGALDSHDELFLHFQPKLGCGDLKLCGAEALVRWQHPQRGLLMPGEFIDIAEQCGLMAPLGRRVLQLAVAQCVAWLEQGLEVHVAVNASPSQFSEPTFVDEVQAILRAAGMPPRLLTIEVTESMAMQDLDATIERLTRLRAAGVQIAVDDFGTGYSNLSQLSRLPLDTLKLDRSLVNGIGSGPKAEAIVRALLGMTRAMGYRTVAEGIETAPQFEFLRAHGCNELQGFLFAKPMAADAFEQWARDNLGLALESGQDALCE